MASTTSLLRLGHRIPVVVWTWSAPLRHFMSWKLDPQLLQLLRDTGKFRRWGLSGERALLGTCLWRECVLHDLFPLLSASQLSQGGQFCSTMCSRPCCVSRHTLRGMEPDNHTLKPSDKINLSSFKLLLSGISHALSPTHTHKHTHKKILHNHILLRSSMKTVRQTVLHENCTVLTSFHFLRSFFTLETSILGKFKQ